MKKNNNTICGKNTTTPPTPPSTPSINKDRRSPSATTDSIHPATKPCKDSIHPIGIAENEKIAQKNANIINAKTTQPHTRCKAHASIRSERVC